jgi:hypothetical protein
MFRIEQSPTQGRFIKALIDLEKGDVLMDGIQCYAFAILDSFKKKVCAVCAHQKPRPKPPPPSASTQKKKMGVGNSLDGSACGDGNPTVGMGTKIADKPIYNLRCIECDQLYFCSLQCQDRHMSTFMADSNSSNNDTISVHSLLLCSPLRKLATLKANSHEKSIMRLILMVLYARWMESHADSIKTVGVIVNNVNNEDDDLNRRMDDLKIQNNNMKFTTDVLALQSHAHEWDHETQNSWKKRISWLVTHTRPFFDGDCEGDDDGSMAESELEDMLVGLVSAIESNGFGLWELESNDDHENDEGSENIPHVKKTKKDKKPGAMHKKKRTRDPLCIGRGLFPTASYFNHSCEPNCQVLQFQNEMRIECVRPVRAGEELTISYISGLNMSRKNRQSLLKMDYFFDCKCEKCVREGEGSVRK